jgi:hypothetical protein
MLKAFVILPLNMCILILNINGPIRAKILLNKRNKRVLQQWGACDVQQIKSEMLMTGYAFTKKEKRILVLRGPESPGQVQSVRKIRILREKVRTLRASAQQQKNRHHTVFQSSINCP